MSFLRKAKSRLLQLLPGAVRRRITEHRQRLRILRKMQAADGAGSHYSLDTVHRYRCVFIHIPRTAGVALTTTLFGSLAGGHLTAENYRFLLGEKRFRSYFKFSVVRNPWDRLVSAFHFLRTSPWQHDRDWFAEHLSGYGGFQDFVENWLTEENVLTEVHFTPQWRFLCSEGGELLVDHLARFEYLAQDFDVIARRLGISRQLEHKNKSTRQSYQGYYAKRTREIVGRVYRRDLELFGYSFSADHPGGGT